MYLFVWIDSVAGQFLIGRFSSKNNSFIKIVTNYPSVNYS